MKRFLLVTIILLGYCFAADIDTLQRDCDRGVAQSCQDLGTMYYTNKGVKQDYSKAESLFNKACNKDIARGCYNLAFMYYTGRGLEKNIKISKAFFTKSCDLGESLACNYVKIIEDKGL